MIKAPQAPEMIELTETEQESISGGSTFACVNPSSGNVIFHGQTSNYSGAMVGGFREICEKANMQWYIL